MEENEVVIKRTFSIEHLNFLFPQSNQVMIRILNPFLYGIVVTLISECLRYEYLILTLQQTFLVYVIIYLFSWLSACTALYGIVSNTPADVATFRPHFVLREWNRPFYIVLTSSLITIVLLTAPAYNTVILIIYGVQSTFFALFIIGLIITNNIALIQGNTAVVTV